MNCLLIITSVFVTRSKWRPKRSKDFRESTLFTIQRISWWKVKKLRSLLMSRYSLSSLSTQSLCRIFTLELKVDKNSKLSKTFTLLHLRRSTISCLSVRAFLGKCMAAATFGKSSKMTTTLLGLWLERTRLCYLSRCKASKKLTRSWQLAVKCLWICRMLLTPIKSTSSKLAE